MYVAMCFGTDLRKKPKWRIENMNEMTNERELDTELNMQELLQTYLRRWKLIVLCMIVGIFAALGITAFCITPMYQSRVTIYVNNNRELDDKNYLSSSDLSASIHLVKGYMIVSESDPVLEKAVAKLGDDYTTTELRNAISTEQLDETVIFTLMVTHADPERAARIATVLSEVIPVEGPKVIDGTSARLINTAKVPQSPSSPSYSVNLLLGAVAGMLLAVVYVTIIFLKDTRIKDENDLTDMFNLPILGRIPDLDSELSSSGYSYSADKD
ncbi:MAG: hypothetical protein E7468_03355 [Ruminococcaceae bacterium]|nr:hypothetical protein [Oscillospiraceae bacterium]